MRQLARIPLLAAAVLGLASTAGAQLYNFPPQVKRITRTFSFEPGVVTILGDHLSLTTSVTVDGVAVPILDKKRTRLKIQPEVSAPGFHPVVVRNRFGSAAGMLELWPTVSGSRIGNLMNTRIANGAVGTCTLYYSTDLLESPEVLPDVGYGRLLDLDAVLSGGIFVVTIFTKDPVTVHKFKIPKDVAITGLPFFVQGMCEQGFPSEGDPTKSFTNLGTIPGLPGNGHDR